MFEIQYFRKCPTKSKNTDMHDLYSIYVKVRKQVEHCLEDYLVDGQNVMPYTVSKSIPEPFIKCFKLGINTCQPVAIYPSLPYFF